MKCPRCCSTRTSKNGRKKGKQNHICLDCGRQFIDVYSPQSGYPEATKQECLKLYRNGMGYRAIARATGVNHATISLWVKRLSQQFPEMSSEG